MEVHGGLFARDSLPKKKEDSVETLQFLEPVFKKGLNFTGDPYANLKKATSEELLKAVIQSLQNAGCDPGFIAGIRYGFYLTQKDGWEHVPPVWLKKQEERHEKP